MGEETLLDAQSSVLALGMLHAVRTVGETPSTVMSVVLSGEVLARIQGWPVDFHVQADADTRLRILLHTPAEVRAGSPTQGRVEAVSTRCKQFTHVHDFLQLHP